MANPYVGKLEGRMFFPAILLSIDTALPGEYGWDAASACLRVASCGHGLSAAHPLHDNPQQVGREPWVHNSLRQAVGSEEDLYEVVVLDRLTKMIRPHPLPQMSAPALARPFMGWCCHICGSGVGDGSSP